MSLLRDALAALLPRVQNARPVALLATHCLTSACQVADRPRLWTALPSPPQHWNDIDERVDEFYRLSCQPPPTPLPTCSQPKRGGSRRLTDNRRLAPPVPGWWKLGLRVQGLIGLGKRRQVARVGEVYIFLGDFGGGLCAKLT